MKNIFALAVLLGFTTAIKHRNWDAPGEFALRRQELKESNTKEE